MNDTYTTTTIAVRTRDHRRLSTLAGIEGRTLVKQFEFILDESLASRDLDKETAQPIADDAQ